MKPTEAASKRGGPSWSHHLQQRYALRFDESLADWFDRGAWQLVGRGEFNQAVSPEVLLAETPEVIWPALMLPDTLPLLGNRNGDWLCLRVGPESTVQEVIHWYHGGGDWIPWGRSLPEAIAFDTIHDRLPGGGFGHAIPAEPRRPADGSGELARWAADWLPAAVRGAIGSEPFAALAEVMLEHRVSEMAVRCELVLAALDSGLRGFLSPELASEIGVPWEPQAVSWLFDTSLVDSSARAALRRSVGASIDYDQDWPAAAAHAAAVCQQRSDLGWAFDIAGWAAEREGDRAAAIHYYRRGAVALAFADQSIRFRTHWFPQPKGKFSLWRLDELERGEELERSERTAERGPTGPQNPPARIPAASAEAAGKEDVDGYLEAVRQSEPEALRSRVAEYWRTVAQDAIASGRPADAYTAHYRAGWDLGLEDIGSYRQRLAGLVDAAEQAGQQGRARVARTHLDTFLQRFG